MTKDEQERFDDYCKRCSVQELAGMLIDLEQSLDKKNRELSALRRGKKVPKTKTERALDKFHDRLVAEEEA